MRGCGDSIKFLFTGPLIVAFLFALNFFTSPGEWWVIYPALGIGLAWTICLFRVVRTALVLGGLAALVAYVANRR